MSVLVVGLSHKSASLGILERAVVSGDALTKLLRDLSQAPSVAGAFVVSTCNRAEVYAEVDKFHGGVSSITELLARHSGIPLSELTPHLYVHYEDRAVQHLLAEACGLDSMVVGESQILGQVRQALGTARDQHTLSRGLGELGALALRTGKRAHTETRIDQAGANLVSVGIAAGLERLGQAPDSLAGRNVLVVGAGSMSSLAATTAARLGAAHIVVANRTLDRAGKLAATVAGSAAELTGLAAPLARADLVISCTGAAGVVITTELVAGALRDRAAAGPDAGPDAGPGAAPGRPLVLLDLAMPRDVDPDVARLPGVHVVGLDSLGDGEYRAARETDIAAVRAIVADEFASRVSAMHAARVAPTVVALRAKAATVVDAELARLEGRLRTADHGMLNEVERAMRRVVDKLLHAPTVRVKELAGSPGGDSYENALRVLFDLDPAVVNAVTVADAAPADTDPAEAGTAEDET